MCVTPRSAAARSGEEPREMALLRSNAHGGSGSSSRAGVSSSSAGPPYVHASTAPGTSLAACTHAPAGLRS